MDKNNKQVFFLVKSLYAHLLVNQTSLLRLFFPALRESCGWHPLLLRRGSHPENRNASGTPDTSASEAHTQLKLRGNRESAHTHARTITMNTGWATAIQRDSM